MLTLSKQLHAAVAKPFASLKISFKTLRQENEVTVFSNTRSEFFCKTKMNIAEDTWSIQYIVQIHKLGIRPLEE